jgi:hypothetical protein
LRDRKSDLDTRGIRVVLVAFTPPEKARWWIAANPSPFPLVFDTERTAYAALGLGRTWWRSFHPRAFPTYLRLMASGMRLRKPVSDPFQLGGDFLIAPDGRLLLAHPSTDPADRPSVDTILQATRKA